MLEGGISYYLYKKMYPTGVVVPVFYGLPKIHKRDILLRPIVSSRGSITHEIAQQLARILRPLVGSSLHHIKNTKNFVQQIQGIQLQQAECISSYDVCNFHICANGSYYYPHEKKIGTRSGSPSQKS